MAGVRWQAKPMSEAMGKGLTSMVSGLSRWRSWWNAGVGRSLGGMSIGCGSTGSGSGEGVRVPASLSSR